MTLTSASNGDCNPKRGSARTVNKRPGDTLDVVDRSMVVLRSTRAPSRHPTLARPTGRTVDALRSTDSTTDFTTDSEEPTT